MLAPYAEEIDGFSSRQLLLSAATPSKHEVVRDLKSLLLGCARARPALARGHELENWTSWRMAATGGTTH